MKLNKLFESTKLVIDNADGIGATGYNKDIDYFGMRMSMKPSVFLSLTSFNDTFTPREKGLEFFKKAIASGEALASPFLIIEIPDEWFEGSYNRYATVTGHEGRHRMSAILETVGDSPIEVHVLLRGKYEIRARRIEDEWVKSIKLALRSQTNHDQGMGKLVFHPFD